jgi:hypothetical protein
MTIETNLQSIENKLDAILIEVKTRPDRNADLENRIADAGTRFTNALATLSIIQNNFTGTSDIPNDEIIYFWVGLNKRHKSFIGF